MKKDRVLISALLFSAVWHLFWLSAFTVVVVPKAARPVKFSNISFLGPLLEHSTLGMRTLEPRERTILEKHYLEYLEKTPARIGDKRAQDYYAAPDAGAWLSSANEEIFTNMTVAAIDEQKIEPGRDVD